MSYYIQVDSKFKLRLLSLSISLFFIPYAYALQPISDEDLGDSTGEGIAFLPENASMQLNGTDNTVGTGYIRYIPVGPLTTTAQDTNKDGSVTSSDHSVGKADIYLYGLAISQSNKDYGVNRTSTDTNSRFDRNINSWGTATNPWLFKVQTEANVPNFSATACTGLGDPSCQVTYLALEAPLYLADTDGNLTNGVNAAINGLSAAEKSAYNLKLGLWADAFVRDPNKAEGDANQFALGASPGTTDATRANRIRLQGVWDGFSINGTNLRLFQTLGGATNTGGMSTFYNNTLGLAGVLRFNSGDGQNLRATVSSNTPTSSTAGFVNRYSTNYTGAPDKNTGAVNSSWLYRIRSQTTTINSTGTWTAPSTLGSVLRFSTRETTDTSLLNTPAINGGAAPSFDASEGLYIYNLNTNLVLGSLYQPLTLGSDGQNITLELARIPNKQSIYTQVYTRYAGDTGDSGVTYSGSTCNIYQCGTTVNLGGTSYQGSNATHSSITIGSTVYDSATNTIQAFKGNATQDAVGISFGALPTSQPVSQNRYFYQLQNQERRAGSYDVSCGLWCTNTYYDTWQYRTVNGWTANAGTGLRFDSARDSQSQAPNWANISDTGNYNPTVANTGYTLTDAGNGASFVVPSSAALPDALYQNGRWYTTTPSTNINDYKLNSSQVNAGVPNNFGSAAIDGLLIQHMKITTKGL